MAIQYVTSTVGDLLSGGKGWDFLINNLDLDYRDPFSKNYASTCIQNLLSHLRTEILVIIETDYIDKVFRDSYYYYFASKLHDISRNCLRLSFIDEKIGEINFTQDAVSRIPNYYLGFVILRPLSLSVLGRNTIAPSALTIPVDFRICKSPIRSTCLSMKTTVDGFPHSSQDGEMMTCAETTVWAILEYFGNKYPEYSPILPSEIHEILKPWAYERQIPSNGLAFDQIASVLKNKGFGTKIYYQAGNPLFKEIFATYLESGIPIAVCIESPYISHAIVAVGHKTICRHNLSSSAPQLIEGRPYYVWNELISDYIFNDDNQLPYSVAPFYDPAVNYTDTEWKGAQISLFIVPLNKKIYMEAETAIGLSKELMVNAIDVDPHSVVRLFLASCRSYKQYLVTNPDIPADKKEEYYKISMPKFIWVTEFADLDSCKRNKINGLMIIDATNPNPQTKPLLFAQYRGKKFMFNNSGDVDIFSLNLPIEMEAFNNNLT